MPAVTIDGRKVEVPAGATILDAARKLGIDIPALCFLDGYQPCTSCLVCLVKIAGQQRLVPACGTQAAEGMVIESQTGEVCEARRTALELLLSDHAGDCVAPCQLACPAQMEIPLALRQIGRQELQAAVATVRRRIALPAVLGWLCPRPCEKACRRGRADGAVAICQLVRYALERDLASGRPYQPQCVPPTGKQVAIVGAGPTGLSAAYYLVQQGHAVSVFDQQPEPGGQLRRHMGSGKGQLPQKVLDAEINLLVQLGIRLHLATRVGQQPSLDDLRRQFDAVLLACGQDQDNRPADQRTQRPASAASTWVPLRWVQLGASSIQVEKTTFQTNIEGLFAAGSVLRLKAPVARSLSDGRLAASSIGQYLAGQQPCGPQKPYTVRMGRLSQEELSQLLANASAAERQEPSGANGLYTPSEAARQAARCLHCDCRAAASCKLRHYAAQYGADPGRYRTRRAAFRQLAEHRLVIYEPGKCIKCGLCIQIAAKAQERLGLTFIGRGFDVRVGVPFNRSLEEALSKVAAQCAAACPTAALSLKEQDRPSEPPIAEG